MAQAKHYAKRNRNLKFIPLFVNPFPKNIEIEYHHINDLLTIPLPKYYHRLYCGNKNYHRIKCNEYIEKIYGFNIEKLLNIF